MEEQLVKMSPKGQLVVPREIRERERLRPSDRFIALEIKGGVLFKKVKIPNVNIEFSSLSREIAEHFKKRKIEEKNVEEAIKWARQKSR